MSAKTPARSEPLAWALPVLLLLGLIVRLIFLDSQGFKTDIATYVAWALALSQHGFASFYTTIGFADYPPGYFYILALVGHLWRAFFAPHDPGYAVLRLMVKLPAVLADLGVGWLIYATARRFAPRNVSLGVAALYLLNPATVYISALWGQVDSISGGFALLAIYFLLRSDGEPRTSGARLDWWIVFAWLSFAYSLLIKPQAAVLLPLIVAFSFADPSRRRARIVAGAVGAVAALLLALTLAAPFHPGNPIATAGWLLERYAYGSNVYPYNSVNAFNLWALRGTMWVPDGQYILFLPQSVWGVVLVVAALALVVWRYLQDRTAEALLEGCAVAALAFFVLATRMHERYLFNGLLFTIVCVPFARRYLWGAVALSIVLFANLQYGLQYLNAVTGNMPGVNSQNLWGIWTTLFSLIAVGTFFVLGYQYLGSADSVERRPEAAEEATPPAAAPAAAPGIALAGGSFRHWFDPREGLMAMRPLDYAIVAVLGIGNFILSFIGYWWPPEKVFDEIYFARAGEEYLQNLRIYENTHPPLSKLLVTLSMMLFGGMPHGHGLGGWTGLNALVGHMGNGDNSYGWRFLDVVFGALVVMLLYPFAKRITGSTIFATIAALLLTFDGMHFVQSRIATPEGFVVFFATLAVYAFYRFWISSQVGERRHVNIPVWAMVAAAAGSLLVGLGVVAIGRPLWGFNATTPELNVHTSIVITFYAGCGIYLLVRYLLFPKWFGDGRAELTYGEGSYALRDGGTNLFAVDGGTIDSRGKITRGAISQGKGGALVYDDEPLTIEYRRDASVEYATPAGAVTYANDEVRTGDSGVVEKGRSSKLWLILFTVALGLLVSSKWYGVMGFGVSFILLFFIWLQRYIFRRPTLWGNPRGFRLDGAFATIVFISATVYLFAWAPDLARQSADPGEIHNVADLVYRQYTMYEYHHNLKATHPYSSQWWEWPLDYVPVAYFYQDHRRNQNDPNGCCIYEITSMPNPVILWFGLFSVIFVAVLALREWKKGYWLIFVTYLLQWLPWIGSPRLIFAYHFYVNIPLICLCNTIALQRAWQWCNRQDNLRWLGGLAVGGYVALAGLGFIYFYPILAAHPISWNAWHHRMWFPTWIIGPG
ncbi:MAG: phospholipid carrier-dependent glycosyltransferase [Candidatus Baltobacteraceae bacterium]